MRFSMRIAPISLGKSRRWVAWTALLALASGPAFAPRAECQNSSPPAAPAAQPSQGTAAGAAPAVRIGLDQAIQLALAHNHTLMAEHTLVSQNQAEEITANLRPNPVLTLQNQYIPLEPSKWNLDNLDQNQEFDVGIGYLFERGHKRRRRLAAARSQTAVTRAQVEDAERNLTFAVAQQFVAVLFAESTLEFSNENLKSFEQTVDLAKTQYQAGFISEGDYLKIQLQLLQFQTDVSSARLARTQALIALRQTLGYNSIPANYDVAGSLSYTPIHEGLLDLQAEALRLRPDLRAAELGIAAAQDQVRLAQANGKQDVSAEFNYVHTASDNDATIAANIPLAVFNRNQGEIARSRFALTQAQELKLAAGDAVLADVSNAFETLESSDSVVKLYTSGYLKEAGDSLDISRYAYKRGAASLLDFLDAERSYRAVQLSYRQALSAYMNALEQLKEAVGTRSLP